jgi:hypothetical protein
MAQFRFPPDNVLTEVVHRFTDAFSHDPRPRAPQLDNATVRELVLKGKAPCRSTLVNSQGRPRDVSRTANLPVVRSHEFGEKANHSCMGTRLNPRLELDFAILGEGQELKCQGRPFAR